MDVLEHRNSLTYGGESFGSSGVLALYHLLTARCVEVGGLLLSAGKDTPQALVERAD